MIGLLEGKLVTVRPSTLGEIGLAAYHVEHEGIIAGGECASADCFTVVREGEPIGSISVIRGYAPQGTVGLAAIVFNKADRQHGYMLEALNLLINALPPSVVRLEIVTASDNTAACNGALRLGFELEGTLRAWYPRGNERVDAILFSKVRV